jgi:GxxExxY protein
MLIIKLIPPEKATKWLLQNLHTMEMTKKIVTKLSYNIISCAIAVHKELGPGLLESVYQRCLLYEVQKRGYHVIQNVFVPVVYDALKLDTELRLDLLVENLVVVELKAKDMLHPVDEAQLLTYMKLLQKPQGLLINFYTDNITKSMKPMVNDYFRNLPDE